MTDFLNRSAGPAVSKGSPIATYQEVDADGVTSGTYAGTFPLIKDSTYNDTHNVDEVFDEGGNKFTADGTKDRSFDITFMQQDAGTKELGYTMDGKYIRIVKEEHAQLIDGKYQYRIFGICKVEKSTSKSAQGGEVPYTVTVLNNSTDLGVDLSEHASNEFQATLTGTYTIPAGWGSKIVEITP